MLDAFDSLLTLTITREIPDRLTRTEEAVLAGLDLALSRYGNPSLAEIAECSGPGYYRQSVHRYLLQLQKKGYVELDQPGRQRRRTGRIRLLKRAEEQ